MYHQPISAHKKDYKSSASPIGYRAPKQVSSPMVSGNAPQINIK